MIIEAKTRAVIIAVLLMALPALVRGEQQAFNPDSIEQIEAKYYGESFLLVIWEINCMPCREELRLLGDLRQTHPDMNLSLIATDDIRYKSEVIRILETNQLAGVDAWMFADPNVERLRYSIDPEWFGELPRNYFYEVDSSRFGFSGKLTEEILDEWLGG